MTKAKEVSGSAPRPIKTVKVFSAKESAGISARSLDRLLTDCYLQKGTVRVMAHWVREGRANFAEKVYLTLSS